MKNPQQELSEIKTMMERSTRFLSLSGLSGIMAGIYALLGASLIYYWVARPNLTTSNLTDAISGRISSIVLIGISALLLSILTAYFLSQKNSRRTSSKLWTPAGKRFLTALFLPVTLGALFCFALLHLGQFELIASSTLLFYGIGLIQASLFTLNDIRYLGFGQVVLGILAAFFPAFGLAFWAIGFGILHILYGSIMYFKYER
jgi:hypothetical protein